MVGGVRVVGMLCVMRVGVAVGADLRLVGKGYGERRGGCGGHVRGGEEWWVVGRWRWLRWPMIVAAALVAVAVAVAMELLSPSAGT